MPSHIGHRSLVQATIDVEMHDAQGCSHGIGSEVVIEESISSGS